jgi:hypothetical protein
MVQAYEELWPIDTYSIFTQKRGDARGQHESQTSQSVVLRKKALLWDADDNDSSDSLEEQEEVSLEEILMNQLDTSEEKLPTKRTCGIIFSDDSDTTLASSEPRTPECRRRSDEDNIDDNDDDDDLWM